MNKFKVGQRVWVKELKQIHKIDKIEKPMLFENYIINGNEYTQGELYETAQTMFEALGYKKIVFENGTIQYQKNKKDKVSRVRFYMKDKVYSAYKTTLYENGVEKNQYTRLNNIKLHQAVHQKMVELGWL